MVKYIYRFMPFDSRKTTIQLDRKLKKQLKVLSAKNDMSYEKYIEHLLRKHGYWDPELEEK